MTTLEGAIVSRCHALETKGRMTGQRAGQGDNHGTDATAARRAL